MTDEFEYNQPQVERGYYPICACGPVSTFGTYLWGGLLVLFGGVWLFDNLNLLPAILLDVFWPLVLIGIGLLYLGRAAYIRR